MRPLVLLAVLTGCDFQLNGGTVPPEDGGPIDDNTVIDTIDMASVCPWPYPVEYVSPCPVMAAGPLVIEGGKWVLDTTTGTLSSGIMDIPITTSIAGDVFIVWTSNFTLEEKTTLRVLGTFPLAIISTSSISIEGVLDAGSHTNDLLGEMGPAANPAACAASAAFPGVGCANHGASGGGGGGFGEAGGQGGLGGDSHMCDQANPDGVAGGSGGAGLPARPTSLRGGCPGASGGTSTNGGSLPGAGGNGGGAIALVAHDMISIDGDVTAGGSGGFPCTNRGGAGGGGSGGFIVLQARSLVIDEDGVVAANGGGGGGGCDNNTGMPGVDGRANGAASAGGTGAGAGDDGGAGGARNTGAQAAEISDRGAGGGGGGVGFLRINTITPVTNQGTVSPIPSP